MVHGQVNVGYDGDIYLTVMLNGAIHTMMYTYYFVSMHAKDIWWKKYMTMMQMIQFLCMNAQVPAPSARCHIALPELQGSPRSREGLETSDEPP